MFLPFYRRPLLLRFIFLEFPVFKIYTAVANFEEILNTFCSKHI